MLARQSLYLSIRSTVYMHVLWFASLSSRLRNRCCCSSGRCCGKWLSDSQAWENICSMIPIKYVIYGRGSKEGNLGFVHGTKVCSSELWDLVDTVLLKYQIFHGYRLMLFLDVHNLVF